MLMVELLLYRGSVPFIFFLQMANSPLLILQWQLLTSILHIWTHARGGVRGNIISCGSVQRS